MKKISFALFIVIIAMLLVSCMKTDPSDSEDDSDKNDGSFNGRDDNINSGNENMTNGAESFVMTATVVSTDELLEVDVVSAPHGNTGRFWVRVSENTSFTSSSGESISLSDVQVGDIIEITYSGQVMMSYPPQIIAISITVK